MATNLVPVNAYICFCRPNKHENTTFFLGSKWPFSQPRVRLAGALNTFVRCEDVKACTADSAEMRERHWDGVFSHRTVSPFQGSVFSLYLHDSVYMYALATDQLLKEGGDKRNGSRIFEISKTKTFDGEKLAIHTRM